MITIKTIAEMADVSIGTVDRVLNNRSGVSDDTRKRVERIIEETGYRGNMFARNLKLGKRARIGTLLPLQSSEFGYWALVMKGIANAAEEFSPFGLEVVSEYFDRDVPGDFISSFSRLEKEKCDAYLIAPLPVSEVSSLGLGNLSEPFAFIDSPVPAFAPISVIAQNPYRGGYAAGRITKLLSPRSGAYISMQIHPDAFNSFERARGFRSYILKDSACRVIDVHVKTVSEIPDALDRLLGENDDVAGIFTANCIINAVGQYLVSRCIKDDIVAVGYDLVDENRHSLKNGYIDAIISQRPVYQGYTAINHLFRYTILGEKGPFDTEIPIDIYLQENIVDGIE